MKKPILLILLLALLIACGGDDTPTQSGGNTAVGSGAEADGQGEPGSQNANNGEQPDKIIVQMALYEWESGSYRELIETFEAENHDIEIKLVSIEQTLDLDPNGFGSWPDDAARRLASAADLFSTNFVGLSDSDLLLDLRPLADADPNFDEADFYPNMLQRFESNGQLFAIPTQANFTLIFFQKDAFDAAGVPYPEAGWSWDDLLQAAQALTVREGDEVTQWGLVQANVNPYELLLPRVGQVIDTDTTPHTPNLETPELTAAMQWLADLYLVHEVAPNLEQPEIDEDGSFIPPGYELIESGQAAIWPEWSGSWTWRSQNMEMGVVPFPVDTANDQTSQLFVNGLSVSIGTQNPEAVWRWLDFLSRQPSVNNFDETAVPARISVAEASGFWDNVDPELGDALTYAVDHSYTTQFTEAYGALVTAFNAVLQEGASVEEALADAQIEAVQMIADAEAEQEAEEEDTEEIVVAAPEIAEVPEGATTIVFAAGGGFGGLQPYLDLVETFRAEHPHIVVDVVSIEFGASPLSLSNVIADADCTSWFGSVGNAEDRAAVLNLDPFFDADPTIDQSDFYPHALATFTDQGQLMGLPTETNISVINYNKALFDEAGVPYPTNGWTLDDFLETAVALTEGDDPETKQYGFVPQEFEINDLMPFLERNGAQLVDENVDPPQLSFTHPDTIDAMRWLTNLTTELGVKPTFTTNIGDSNFNNGEERKTLIENGRAAMWSDQGFGSFPEIDLDTIELGVVAFPTGPNGNVTITNSTSGYYISSETEHRQACWEWITFLSEQPKVNENGNMIPARPSVAQSDAYAQSVGAELAAANLASVEDSTEPSINLRFNSDLSWLSLGSFWWQSYAYDQILSNDVSVEDALNDIQEKADAYRNCVIEQDGFNDNSIQRTCLGGVDDTVPSFFVDVD